MKTQINRLHVRYALSLATDREAIADFLGAGHQAASGVVPPIPGYPVRRGVFVSIHRRKLNVLNFDPAAARALLGAENLAGGPLTLTFPVRPGSIDIAPIVQAQWRKYLGIQVILRNQEETAWEQSILQRQYRHVIEDSWTAFYEDPYDFLGQFGTAHYAATTWADPAFDAALDKANRVIDVEQRMRALAECEDRLLLSMPLVPITFDAWATLEAPYISGLRINPFGCPRFKYASIETNWRPQ